MNNRSKWGWNEHLEAEFVPLAQEGWNPGRIVRPGRGVYRIAAADGSECNGRLTGRALTRGDLPAAGDWVAWRIDGGTALIDTILPRRTVISRKVPGDRSREQILAVNVDVLYIVQGLGGGRSFNLRGLERYVTMAWESGCRPVAVLNKADLTDDIDADVMEAETVAPGVPVYATSTVTGEGIPAVRDTLAPGETGAFVGPSGVGKSSLVNALAGSDLTDTGKVREDDRRGRHTTTARELHLLPDGRILLDTPGLRELQLWGDGESADAAFPEIEELAVQCRFRDCRHDREPGCAVRAGLESGAIDPARFDSWLELRRELVWLEARRDERSRRELEQKWIGIAKASRLAQKGREIW